MLELIKAIFNREKTIMILRYWLVKLIGENISLISRLDRIEDVSPLASALKEATNEYQEEAKKMRAFQEEFKKRIEKADEITEQMNLLLEKARNNVAQ